MALGIVIHGTKAANRRDINRIGIEYKWLPEQELNKNPKQLI